jgi:hypothetical protein
VLERGKQNHLSASTQGLRRAIRVLPVGGFLPVHLSHRLERGRSPVYCFGPGPYHLPGRQPNSACRSADHLFAWEPFAPFELPWTCRLCWGKEGAQALHFGRRNGRPLPVLRSQGTHNMCIYIHIYIYIYTYIHIIYIYMCI